MIEASPATSPSLRSERSCWRVLLSTTSFKVCLQGRSFCFLHTCLMLLLVMKWNETFKQGFEVLLRCRLNVSLKRYFNCSLWNSLTGIVPYDWTLYCTVLIFCTHVTCRWSWMLTLFHSLTSTQSDYRWEVGIDKYIDVTFRSTSNLDRVISSCICKQWKLLTMCTW